MFLFKSFKSKTNIISFKGYLGFITLRINNLLVDVK
jgi:hypothetical protein